MTVRLSLRVHTLPSVQGGARLHGIQKLFDILLDNAANPPKCRQSFAFGSIRLIGIFDIPSQEMKCEWKDRASLFGLLAHRNHVREMNLKKFGNSFCGLMRDIDSRLLHGRD